MSCLNQYEEEVSEEEHESVVEHDGVEERLVREDQVDDVGDEETEDRDAQHDGVNDPENVWFTPRQTDVHHPPTSAQARGGRGQAVPSPPEPQGVARLVRPLSEDQVHPSSRPLQPDVVIAGLVRVQLSLDSQVLLLCTTVLSHPWLKSLQGLVPGKAKN